MQKRIRGDGTPTQQQRMILEEIEQGLKMSYIRENKNKEEKATEAIDEIPKCCYRYAKLKVKIKASIGILKKMDGSEDLVTDNPEMCEKLGEQFVSPYSVPLPSVKLPSNDNDLDSQGISVLAEVRSNSSAGPNGAQAVLLKKPC